MCVTDCVESRMINVCGRCHCKCSVCTDVGIEGPEGPDNLMVKRLSVTVDRTRLKGEVSGARP